MIKLKVLAVESEDRATEYKISPSPVMLGGKDSYGVETLQLIVPVKWEDATVFATFTPDLCEGKAWAMTAPQTNEKGEWYCELDVVQDMTVTAKGLLTISAAFGGETDEDGNLLETTAMVHTHSVPYIAYNHEDLGAEATEEPSTGAWDQYIASVQQAAGIAFGHSERASAAATAAQAAEANAKEYEKLALQDRYEAREAAQNADASAATAAESAQKAEGFAERAEEAAESLVSFYATYGVTSYADVLAAYKSGRSVYCVYYSYVAPLNVVNEGAGAIWFYMHNSTTQCGFAVTSENKWLRTEHYNTTFYATYEKTPFAEIEAAYRAGRAVRLIYYETMIGCLTIINLKETEYNYNYAQFEVVDSGGTLRYVKVSRSDIWTIAGSPYSVAPIRKGTGTNSVQQVLDATSWAPDASQTELIGDPAVQKDENNILTGAFGDFSEAMGGKSQAVGKRARAEGTSTVALGNYSHAEGNKTFSKGVNSHAEGLLTNAIGGNSHAEGANTRANGDNSHAEGDGNTASGYASHTEGNGNVANGDGSHAEGSMNNATGECSHVEGAGNTASGYTSHAEGDSNKATGSASHAGGVLSEANHNASFVHGTYLKTGRANQAVFGEYNAVDANAVFVVGNGTSETDRKNAFQVNADGTAYVNGKKMGDVFFAEYGKTTQSEVRAAIDGGKLAVCYYNNSWYIVTFAPSGAPFINFTAVSTSDAGGNPNNSLPTIGCLNLSGNTWKSGSGTLATTDKISGLVASEVLAQVNNLKFISYIDYSKVSYYDDIQAGIYAGKTIVLTKDIDGSYKDYYHLAQYANGVDNNPPPEYLFTCIKTNADKQVVLKRIVVAMGEIGGTELEDIEIDASLDKSGGIVSFKADGTQVNIPWGYNTAGNSIARRLGNGTLWVETPDVDKAAANKAYVDGKVCGHYTTLRREGKMLDVICHGLVNGETYTVQLFTAARRRGNAFGGWRHPSNENTGEGFTGKGYARLAIQRYAGAKKMDTTAAIYPEIPEWMPRYGILQTEWSFTAAADTHTLTIDLAEFILPMLKPEADNFEAFTSGAKCQMIGVARGTMAPLLMQFRVERGSTGAIGESKNTLRIGEKIRTDADGELPLSVSPDKETGKYRANGLYISVV